MSMDEICATHSFEGQMLAYSQMEEALEGARKAYDWLLRDAKHRKDAHRESAVKNRMEVLTMFWDEIAIQKRKAREAHVEEMSR